MKSNKNLIEKASNMEKEIKKVAKGKVGKAKDVTINQKKLEAKIKANKENIDPNLIVEKTTEKKRGRKPIVSEVLDRCMCVDSFCNANQVTDKTRQNINSHFKKLTLDDKHIYIESTIDVEKLDVAEPGRYTQEFRNTYHLKWDNSDSVVCRRMFVNTVGLGEWTIRNWLGQNKQLNKNDKAEEQLEEGIKVENDTQKFENKSMKLESSLEQRPNNKDQIVKVEKSKSNDGKKPAKQVDNVIKSPKTLEQKKRALDDMLVENDDQKKQRRSRGKPKKLKAAADGLDTKNISVIGVNFKKLMLENHVKETAKDIVNQSGKPKLKSQWALRYSLEKEFKIVREE